MVFKIVPSEDHGPNINNPPTSDRSSLLAVVLLLVILFLIWISAMEILQQREQDQWNRELLDRISNFQEQCGEFYEH